MSKEQVSLNTESALPTVVSQSEGNAVAEPSSAKQHSLETESIERLGLELIEFFDANLSNSEEAKVIDSFFPEIGYQKVIELMVKAYKNEERRLIYHVKSMLDLLDKYYFKELLTGENLRRLYLGILYHDSAKLLENNSVNELLKHLLEGNHGHSLAIQRVFLYLGLPELGQTVRHNDEDFCIDYKKLRITPDQLVLNILDRLDSSGKPVDFKDKSAEVFKKIGDSIGFNAKAHLEAYSIIEEVYEILKLGDIALAKSLLTKFGANIDKPMKISIVGRMDARYHPPVGKYADTSSAIHLAKNLLPMNWHTQILHGGEFLPVSFDGGSIQVFPVDQSLIHHNYESLCKEQDVILVEGFTSIIPPLIKMREYSQDSTLISVIFRGFSGGKLRNDRLENIRHADEIWGVSSSVVNAISSQLDGVTPKLKVIPNGVDHSIFRIDESVKRKKGKIVYVGALKDEKGVGLLLRAFRKARELSSNLELHLIGSGEMYGSKTERIEEDGVIVHGQLSHESVAEHLRSAHISVLLSSPELFETFGKAIEEAKACGCPVIVSNSGALPERVFHSSIGEIVYDLNEDNVADILKKWTNDEPKNIEKNNSRIYDWKISAVEIITSYYEYLRKTF